MRLVKIKNFLVYLLLFLLPWQTRLILRPGELNGGYWEYGTVSIYATEIILWAALLIFAFLLIKEKGFQISDFRFQIWLFIIGYLLFISLFALRRDVHFYYLLRFIEGAALYLLIKSVNRKIAVWAFIFGMIPQAVLGIWQFLTQSSFANKWLGLAVHDPAALGTFVIETVSGRWLRAYGGLPHPNILGAYLALSILLLFSSKFYDRKKEGKSYDRKLSTIYRASFAVFSAALFFTFSRSAWLALAAGLIFILSRPRQDKQSLVDFSLRQRWVREIFQGILVCAITFIVLALVFRGPFASRLQSEERLEVKSQVERISGYKEAWGIFKKYPIIGVGLGNYTYAVWKETDASHPAFAYQPAHNAFLLFLTELGIVGALLVVVLLYLYRKSFTLPALVFLVVLGFFDHYLLSLYPGIILVAIALTSFPSKLKI